MPISWNEIRHNAYAFAKEWEGESREEAEAKSFWDAFFAVFGAKRRLLASFEEPVKKLSGNWSFIDLFWAGTMLAEHKSRGKSLDKANSQAMEYIRGLKDSKRDDEIPRYVIVSDFARIAIHDLETDATTQFDLADLHKHIYAFAFIPGYEQHDLTPDDPVNIKAVEVLGKLHAALKAGGYPEHDLERFLVRILFCLFAERTGIFDASAFTLYLQNHTREDGSDLGMHLQRVFGVLDQEENDRQANLLEELAELPHVNGDLFKDSLDFADFDRTMRDQLMRCAHFDWSQISPAIFGSLFQIVMAPKERRQTGAHYTSERDIMKVIRSLFLDDLRADFDKLKTNKSRLKEFHKKLGALRFLDPACGCGNFLVVAYRELRRLELEVLRLLYGDQRVIDVHGLSLVDVDAMFGIEINEFSVRIAEVAMWLVDHQMNQMLSTAFGQYFVRLPLRKSPMIKCDNALRIKWEDVLPVEQCSFILGNPPFVGSRFQTKEQRADMKIVTSGVKKAGILDYVTAWYFKASEYIRGTGVQVAFVSTNSITQGEQVGVLWQELFRRGVRPNFGHRTFAWVSEAHGKAHVHVVIIGFGLCDNATKRIYDYESGNDNPTSTVVRNISPYLIEGSDTAITNRSKPICDVPKLLCGNQPIDDGNYLFTSEEKAAFVKSEPKAAKWFRRIYGSKEYINGKERWCLWLGECSPSVLHGMPECMKRIDAVRRFRLKSNRPSTVKLAVTPTRFQVETMPKGKYIFVPSASSERRQYIPIGFMPPEVMASNLANVIDLDSLFHFGVLTSAMHMAWVKVVCGRLKSDYRYSVKLVYNNFPWPQNASDKQKSLVELRAKAVLNAREEFPDASPAKLYNPLTMPKALSSAHAELNKAVDLCYRPQPFASERARVEYLFDLYEKIVTPLAAGAKKLRRTRKSTKKLGG